MRDKQIQYVRLIEEKYNLDLCEYKVTSANKAELDELVRMCINIEKDEGGTLYEEILKGYNPNSC